MIGRTYSPTNLDAAHLLGRTVTVNNVEGYISNVHTDGTVTVEGYNGLVIAIVKAEDVTPV